LLNTAQARYDLAMEASYQHRGAGNSAGQLTGSPKVLFDFVVATNSSSTVIRELNLAFSQGGYATGLLARPGTPTAPSAGGAGVLTEAEVVANPVSTWTRAPSGTPNSCQPAYVLRETGLDALVP